MRERVGAAGRPLGAGDVGDDLPLRLRADAARRRRAARLLARLHDLRPVGLAADAETLPDRARGRPETLPAAGDPREDLRRQEPADRRRLPTPKRSDSVFEEIVAEAFPLYEKRMLRSQRDGLRRPPRPHRQRDGAVRGGPRALAPHLPPRPRRRVPGHQPRPVPAAAAARRRARQPDGGRRRRRSRSTASATPTSATSSTSSSDFPEAPRWSSSSRTTARRRRSSRPPTRSIERNRERPQKRALDRRSRAASRCSSPSSTDEHEEARWVAGEIERLGEEEGVEPLRGRGLLPDQRDEPGAGGHAAAASTSPTR